MSQRYTTLAELAEEAAVSVSVVYACMRSGQLRAIKLGGAGQWRLVRTSGDGCVATVRRAAGLPSES